MDSSHRLVHLPAPMHERAEEQCLGEPTWRAHVGGGKGGAVVGGFLHPGLEFTLGGGDRGDSRVRSAVRVQRTRRI